MLSHKNPAALAGDDRAEDEGTAESIAEPDRRNFIANFQIALAAPAPAAIPETAENLAGGRSGGSGGNANGSLLDKAT